LGERTAFSKGKTDAAQTPSAPLRADPAAETDEFASQRAALGKAQFWLTVFTVGAVIAVLLIVSVGSQC
jgi:hypothetical protein